MVQLEMAGMVDFVRRAALEWDGGDPIRELTDRGRATGMVCFRSLGFQAKAPYVALTCVWPRLCASWQRVEVAECTSEMARITTGAQVFYVVGPSAKLSEVDVQR